MLRAKSVWKRILMKQAHTGLGLLKGQQQAAEEDCYPLLRQQWQKTLGRHLTSALMTPQRQQFWQLTTVKQCFAAAAMTDCQHLLHVAGRQQPSVAVLPHLLSSAHLAVHLQLLSHANRPINNLENLVWQIDSWKANRFCLLCSNSLSLSPF